MDTLDLNMTHLARELGVSWSTVWRWFNEGREPIKPHRREIERLIRKAERQRG